MWSFFKENDADGCEIYEYADEVKVEYKEDDEYGYVCPKTGKKKFKFTDKEGKISLDDLRYALSELKTSELSDNDKKMVKDRLTAIEKKQKEAIKMAEDKNLEAKFAEQAEKLEALEAEKEQLLKDKEQAEIKLAEADKAAKENEFETYFNEKVGEGKLLPAQKDAVKGIMFSFNDECIKFSEEGKEVEKKPVELFKEFVDGIKQVDFSEKSEEKEEEVKVEVKAGYDEKRGQLLAYAEKISKEKDIKIAEALVEATDKHPELA
jgi:hypothetical protein